MKQTVAGMSLRPDCSIRQQYNIDNLPIYIVRENIYNCPNHKTTPHWNTDLEFVLIGQGSMNVTVNGVATCMKEKDICILQAGCVHYFESCSGEDCSYFVGILNESVFSANPYISKNYLQPLFHSFHPHCSFVHENSEYHQPLMEIFSGLFNVITEKKPAYELLIAAKCYELLVLMIHLLEDSNFDNRVPDNKYTDALRNMLGFISQNYHTRISPERLCQVGGVSRNMCFRLFQEYTGDSPANFILKYRLSMAQSHLADDTIPISQVAMNCGFSQQSHFTQHFTKYYGITPLQFRKSYKESR